MKKKIYIYIYTKLHKKQKYKNARGQENKKRTLTNSPISLPPGVRRTPFALLPGVLGRLLLGVLALLRLGVFV